MKSINKIAVAGTGYVGLSNALLLAETNEVIGIDISDSIINNLNNKISHRLDYEFDWK